MWFQVSCTCNLVSVDQQRGGDNQHGNSKEGETTSTASVRRRGDSVQYTGKTNTSWGLLWYRTLSDLYQSNPHLVLVLPVVEYGERAVTSCF